MKICSLYGDGFYYIPGTDTCLKMGGYVRVQAEYNMGGGGVPVGDSAGGELSQGRFTRDLTNDINYRVRGAISWDVRQQTEYGTLRTYIRFGAENTTPKATGGGTTFSPFWDRAFIQFAGFTVGRSQSFFDLFTYGGAYSYHNVRVSGDTGASGQNLWAYTAQFGNGFSGTLSLEDPATRKGGTVDLATGGFPLIPAAALVNDNAFAINKRRRPPSASACLTSSPTCALIRPGASSASALLCMTPAAPTTVNAATNVQQRPSRRQVRLGVGWRRQVQPCRRRHDRLQRLLRRRRSGLLHQQRRLDTLQLQQQRGRGLDRRRRLQHRHRHRAHQGLECSRRVRAHLEPEMAYLGVRRLRQRPIRQRCHQRHPAAHSGRVGRLRRRPASALLTSAITLLPGNSCSPDQSFWEAGTRTQWNPVPQLDIGLEVLYSQRNTAFKGVADRARQRLAARRAQRAHRRPERLVRDVPLAAQLLSMIA